jgi:hypothetical protein
MNIPAGQNISQRKFQFSRPKQKKRKIGTIFCPKGPFGAYPGPNKKKEKLGQFSAQRESLRYNILLL